MNSPKFQKALTFTFEREGYYSNDPNDGGGATAWGITHDDWNRWYGRTLTVDEVSHQAKSEAAKIYEAWYWAPINGDAIVDDTLALMVFDQGVNCGVYRAAVRLQKVVGTTPDGKIGPITLAATNKMNAYEACKALFHEAQMFYVNIVKNNWSQHVFLLGWVNRTHFYLDEFVTNGWIGADAAKLLKTQQLGHIHDYLAGGSIVNLIEAFS